jgi:coenzyme F420-reducing hydrogenase beta subunit
MDQINVSGIVQSKLCVQCGTCVAVCPHQAIHIEEWKRSGLLFPIIDQTLCDLCGLCNAVCPVNQFSLETQPISEFQSIGIFRAESPEDTNRLSSSGGAVSATLKYLFRKSLIDKALVVVQQPGKVLEPAGTIISNEAKVDQARGSVYQPVALNSILDELSKKDKIAFVGLPCHMQGLTAYINRTKKLNVENVLRIGIFCNNGRSRNATRFLIKKYSGRSPADIRSIHYRKGDYPGYLCLETGQGEAWVDYHEYMTRLGYFFTPRGCLFCDDLFNEKADISVGDPWGLVEEKKAMIITRTDKGRQIVREMAAEHLLELEKPLDRQAALGTQNYKYKQNRGIRSRIYQKMGIRIPAQIEKELSREKSDKLSPFNLFLSVFLITAGSVFNSRFYPLAGFFPYKLLSRMSRTVKSAYRKNGR